MSESQTNTKIPLWKQLLGALAGAVVAFVIYQAYAFTSGHLQAMNRSLRSGSWQALVTLPGGAPASSVTRPPRSLIMLDPVSSSSSSSVMAIPASSSASSVSSSSAQSSSDRVYYGPFGTLRGLKKYFQFQQASSSSAIASSAAASSSSASPIPVSDSRHLWPTSTLGFPGEVYQQTSSSSSPSVRVRTPSAAIAQIPVAPLSPEQQAELERISADAGSPDGMEDLASSVPSDAAAEEQQMSSPSWIAPAIVAGVPASARTSGRLPNSGFGLDLLAFMAIGGALGSRMKRR